MEVIINGVVYVPKEKSEIDSYDEMLEYRLKPKKEEYPQFRIDKDGYILKWEEESLYEVMISSSAKDIGKKFCRSIWNDLKPIPYNKERGLYHKQPVWCWDKYITISRAICFYDAVEDMVFEQYSNNGKITRSSFGNIEAITPEQLKTMPFIFEMYKQLEE